MAEGRVVAVRGSAVVGRPEPWTADLLVLCGWLAVGVAVGRGSALSGFAGLGPALLSALVVWSRGTVRGVRAPDRAWPNPRSAVPWLAVLAVVVGYATVGTLRGTAAMLVVLLLVPALPRRLHMQPAWWAALQGAVCAVFGWVAVPGRSLSATGLSVLIQALVGAALAAVALLGAAEWGLEGRREAQPTASGSTAPWGRIACALAAGACAAGTADVRGGVIAGAIVGAYTVWVADGPGEGALAGALAGGLCMPALASGALAPGAAAVAGTVAGLCRGRHLAWAPLGYTAATAAVAAAAVAPAWGWCLGAAAGGFLALAVGSAGRLGRGATSAPPAGSRDTAIPVRRPPLADRLLAAARTCIELSRGLAEVPLAGGGLAADAERGMRLAEEVCPGCPALSACWERKLPRARQMVTELWREAQSGTATWQNVGGPDTIFCLRPREMAEAANRHAALGRQRQEFLRLMEASRQSAVTPLVGIGRVLSDLAEEVAATREREVLAAQGAEPPEQQTPVQERWTAEPAAGRLGFEAVAVTLARPGRTVSGDSVRCRSLSGDRLALAISDGMGSGGPAAVTSAAAIEHLLAALAAGISAEDALRQTNDHMVEDSSAERFATVALAIIHLRGASLEWFSMGAPPGFFLHARGVREWGGGGLPAGILTAPEIRSGRARIRPGDVLVLVSDGIVERGGGIASGGPRHSRSRWTGEWLRANRVPGSVGTMKLAAGLVAAACRRAPDREHDDLTVLACQLRAAADATRGETIRDGHAAEVLVPRLRDVRRGAGAVREPGGLTVQAVLWPTHPPDRRGKAYATIAPGTRAAGGPGVRTLAAR